MTERDALIEVVVSWGDEVLEVLHLPPEAIDAPLVPAGETVQLERGGLTLVARWTEAALAVPRSVRSPGRSAVWIAVSSAAHAAMVAALLAMPPRVMPIGLRMNPDSVPIDFDDEEHLATVLPGTGEADLGREGALGTREERRTRGRFAVPGRSDEPTPRLAPSPGRSLRSIDSVGAIGAVRAMMGVWNVPTSPYGAAQAHGEDATAALGAMMARRLGHAEGMDGLGMRGTGRGGGGMGEGTIGLGALGTIGHGAGGVPEGQGSAAGPSHRRRAAARRE